MFRDIQIVIIANFVVVSSVGINETIVSKNWRKKNYDELIHFHGR